MSTVTTYGIGGYDSSKPDNNVIDVLPLDDQHNPLDRLGALATLLAVLGVVSVEDAANAVWLLPDDLVAEANAWAAAAADQ